jgi:hypothetical protein
MRDSQLFDEAVARYFRPQAERHGLSFTKIEDGIYDVGSGSFIMRIRLHTGHARGLNVMMRSSEFLNFGDDTHTPGVMYGIGCFIEHAGQDWREFFIEVDSNETFLRQAEILAQAAERFLIPYLLGHRNDFCAIKANWDAKAARELEDLKKLKFPSFVQKRWHLPPPPKGDEQE